MKLWHASLLFSLDWKMVDFSAVQSIHKRHTCERRYRHQMQHQYNLDTLSCSSASISSENLYLKNLRIFSTAIGTARAAASQRGLGMENPNLCNTLAFKVLQLYIFCANAFAGLHRHKWAVVCVLSETCRDKPTATTTDSMRRASGHEPVVVQLYFPREEVLHDLCHQHCRRQHSVVGTR